MNDNSPINTSNYVDENGKFKKGNKGKPKGAVNRTTKDIKEFIVNFLNDKSFEIPLIWDSLEDKDKLNLFVHLSKLVLPRTPEIETETKEPQVFEIEFVKSEPIESLPLNERIAKLNLTQNEIYEYLNKTSNDLEKEY
jgi:hypothetical protein